MGKFEKGQSGNPAGRPARAVEEAQLSVLQRIFDRAAEESVVRNQILIASTPGKGSTMAAKWLFDRKYGPLVATPPEPDGETVIRVEYED